MGKSSKTRSYRAGVSDTPGPAPEVAGTSASLSNDRIAPSVDHLALSAITATSEDPRRTLIVEDTDSSVASTMSTRSGRPIKTPTTVRQKKKKKKAARRRRYQTRLPSRPRLPHVQGSSRQRSSSSSSRAHQSPRFRRRRLSCPQCGEGSSRSHRSTRRRPPRHRPRRRIRSRSRLPRVSASAVQHLSLIHI